MNLSIIIPVHNEAGRLDDCIGKWYQYFCIRPVIAEIILVENGSSDATWYKCHRWAKTISYPEIKVLQIGERSKAMAVRAGVMEARGDIVYMADCDLSTPPDELQKFINAIRAGNDVAIGSRKAPGAKVTQGWRRRMVSSVFSLLTGFLLPGIQDTQCGFKAFTLSAALNLFSRLVTSSMAFDVEILLRARRFSYQIAELPVEWSESRESRVRLVKDSLSMALDVVKLSRMMS
jgi:dolichyl-phosphate beta-glucosyltransferase